MLDPHRLSETGRVDALIAWEKLLAWTHAQQLKLLAVMAGRSVQAAASFDAIDKNWVREDVATALRLSGAAATDRLCLARAATRMAATMAMLERGEITHQHVRALAEALVAFDDDTATSIESCVLPGAGSQSIATFRRRVNRAVMAAAPTTTEQQHRQAMAERRVAIRPAEGGMSELWALLPADGAMALKAVLDARAVRGAANDDRTADQRRADALVRLGVDALDADTLVGASCGKLPSRHGLRPAVSVTVAMSTLLGLDEQPAELDGHGPIPAALARRLAADPTGTWRRLVTDELGRLIDYGRASYRPPAALAEHVIARDRTCRFPNYKRQARTCELDHRIAWQSGGRTSETNLHALCPRHHHLKHETGWTCRASPDGSITWTSPTGHRYREPPDPYAVDTTTGRPNEAATDTQ